MSVLIKGLKMPQKGLLEVIITPDGIAYELGRPLIDTEHASVSRLLDAVELPDHRDLIDRAAALEEIESFYPPKVRGESEAEEINRVGWECAINCIEAYLRTVKPVIPAERSEASLCDNCYRRNDNGCCVCKYIEDMSEE